MEEALEKAGWVVSRRAQGTRPVSSSTRQSWSFDAYQDVPSLQSLLGAEPAE